MDGVFWLGVSLILGTLILLMCDLWVLRQAANSYKKSSAILRMDLDLLAEKGFIDKEAAIAYSAKIAEIDAASDFKPIKIEIKENITETPKKVNTPINNEVCSVGCPKCDGIHRGGKAQ